ncbi:MAG: EscN/YscN/HrcN family type III secretion system ATPase, partial [Synergistaceae bacterium]|nr:EscN/YscN/HrcN family type III secretion system ATPase [Synergistaceae bacterium]
MTTKTADDELLQILEHRLGSVQLTRINGRIVQVVGLVAESQGPDVRVGDLCSIRYRNSESSLSAE